MRGLVVSVLLCGCRLVPPPAIDPATQQTAAPEPAPAEPVAIPTAPAEPAPQSEDAAKLEMMMAEPDCVVEVVDVLESARGFWSDTKKYTCTYEVVINGQRYKYTRQLPKARGSEPAEVCEKGLSTTDSAVRAATDECKDLQAGERPVAGLIPIR